MTEHSITLSSPIKLSAENPTATNELAGDLIAHNSNSNKLCRSFFRVIVTRAEQDLSWIQFADAGSPTQSLTLWHPSYTDGIDDEETTGIFFVKNLKYWAVGCQLIYPPFWLNCSDWQPGVDRHLVECRHQLICHQSESRGAEQTEWIASSCWNQNQLCDYRQD